MAHSRMCCSGSMRFPQSADFLSATFNIILKGTYRYRYLQGGGYVGSTGATGFELPFLLLLCTRVWVWYNRNSCLMITHLPLTLVNLSFKHQTILHTFTLFFTSVLFYDANSSARNTILAIWGWYNLRFRGSGTWNTSTIPSSFKLYSDCSLNSKWW